MQKKSNYRTESIEILGPKKKLKEQEWNVITTAYLTQNITKLKSMRLDKVVFFVFRWTVRPFDTLRVYRA